MIYIDNETSYSQRIFIPKDEDSHGDVTGHTISLQRKDYEITENGVTRIHPDAGYDGISGGSIGVYVSAATGVTFQHLNVTEDGVYVPTGDSVYTGVTVQVYDSAYQDGYNDGYSSGYTVGFQDGYASGYTVGTQDGYASGSTEGYTSGYTEGYASGSTDGYASGRTDGYNDGYASGHTDGLTEGYTSGYTEGYTSGSTDGYASGRTDGFNAGYASGVTDGYNTGYASGMTDGFNAGYTSGVTDTKKAMSSIEITDNGIWTSETGYSAVTVDVNTVNNQSKTLTLSTGDTYTAKTQGIQVTPDSGYTGLDRVTVQTDFSVRNPIYAGSFTDNGNYTINGASVGYPNDVFNGYYFEVNVDTASTYQEGYAFGYNAGYPDGVNHQKSLLSATTIDTDGIYTSQDGWSSVTVNVGDRQYSQGYDDGVAHQKSLLSAYTFTANTGGNQIVFPDGLSGVTVNIPLSDVIVTATTNGLYEYHAGSELFGNVLFTVDVPQSGSTPILTAGTFSQNGNYTPPQGVDGFSSVNVSVNTAQTYNDGYAAGYSSGVTDGIQTGISQQKALLASTAFTNNGTYTSSDGWSSVTVNYDTAYTYNQGYTSGVTHQKNLLASTGFTSNGTYTRTNGWDSVTVNVPQTNVVTLTQAQYDALPIKDNNTIYLIKN